MCRSISAMITPFLPALFLVTLCVVAASSAVPAAQAKAATCMTLLTDAEVTAAVGTAMENLGGQERNPGETECSWMIGAGKPGFKTVSVQFYDLSHIKSGAANETPEQFFEDIVSGTEGVATGKRQMLTGIGVKAAFVPTDPQVLAVVLLKDGVARIVGNNLTRAQITQIARAVAGP